MSGYRLALALALAVMTLGCALATPSAPSAPTPTQTAAIEHARAFQADYDRELREDERSFLTVVAATYLAPGEQLRLALVDGAWAQREAATLRFEATPEQLIVRGLPGAADTDETHISASTLIPVGDDGRFAFGISMQSDSWRVQIHDRDAPLRASFPGISWFPVDPARIVEAQLEPRPNREPTLLQTSRGVTKTLYVIGEAVFELDGHGQRLQVFAYAAEPSPDEPLLIPFRDQTSGHQSYAAGRYLELVAPAGAALPLDFNRATNPLCAYSEHFNCPMPPRFNTLEVAIEAGAKAPWNENSAR